MVNLTLIEKLAALIEIVKSSSVFIILFLITAMFITKLVIDLKNNKKVNTKLILGAWATVTVLTIVAYATSLLSFADNFVEKLVATIYFPNFATYLFMLVFVNTSLVITLVKNKNIAYKINTIVTAFITNFLFVMTLDLIVKNNVNIYEKLTVYSNEQLLVLIELTSLLFTASVIVNLFIKLVEKTLAKVNPTAVTTDVTANQIVIELDEESLLNKFNNGEELTATEFATLKNYIILN